MSISGITPGLPIIGGAQPDYVETFAGPLAAASTVANQANFVRVRVAKAITVTTMAYIVGTASGNVDLGIYDSPDGGATLTRLSSTGSTAAAGTSAIQAIALTTPVTLTPGKDYWFAFAADNGTITAMRLSTVPTYNSRKNRALAKAANFPLPTSVASLASGLTYWLEAS